MKSNEHEELEMLEPFEKDILFERILHWNRFGVVELDKRVLTLCEESRREGKTLFSGLSSDGKKRLFGFNLKTDTDKVAGISLSELEGCKVISSSINKWAGFYDLFGQPLFENQSVAIISTLLLDNKNIDNNRFGYDYEMIKKMLPDKKGNNTKKWWVIDYGNGKFKARLPYVFDFAKIGSPIDENMWLDSVTKHGTSYPVKMFSPKDVIALDFLSNSA